jgi:alpha-N-acetylglucosamine transferase
VVFFAPSCTIRMTVNKKRDYERVQFLSDDSLPISNLDIVFLRNLDIRNRQRKAFI